MTSSQRLAHSVLNNTKIKMKVLFAILALCLATASAFTVESPEILMDSLVKEMNQRVAAIESELKTNLELIVGLDVDCDECDHEDPDQLERALERLEARRIRCIKDSVNSSVELAQELSAPVRQLVFDGAALVESFKKCEEITGTIQNAKCRKRLLDDFLAYLEEARKSINALKEGSAKAKVIVSDAKECLARKPKLF